MKSRGNRMTDDPPTPGWGTPSSTTPPAPLPHPPPGWMPPAPQPRSFTPTHVPAPTASGPAGWRPPTAPARFSGAAHKPGVVPLRPLGLGDVYDAAFRTIRANPRSTVGAAVLVAAVSMAIPVVLTAVLSWFHDLPGPLNLDPATTSPATSSSDVLAQSAPSLALVGGTLLSALGLVFVTGMVSHVCLAAALGRTLSLPEAWAATRGRRWRMLGLSIVVMAMAVLVLTAYVVASTLVVLVGVTPLTVVWFVLTVPALVLALWWVWIRLCYLPVPVMMLERTGVFASIRRGHALTSRQFWRTLGIALLTLLITWFATQILSTPFSMIGMIAAAAMGDSRWAILVLVAGQALGSVLATAFTSPFTAAVTSVQYLDQRFRKEGYDLELMTRAGLTPTTEAGVR